MLKTECVARLDLEIAALETSVRSLRDLRETLWIESESGLEKTTVSTAPTGEVSEGNDGADGGGAPAAEAVQETAVDSQGVDAAGAPIIPGHTLYKE